MNPTEWLSANLSELIVALAQAGAAIHEQPVSGIEESHGVDTGAT